MAQNMQFLDPKGLTCDHLGPNMADNWFADQLIGLVGLGALAVFRKTPIYFILQKKQIHKYRSYTNTANDESLVNYIK